MAPPLPSLSALRAFEAAARHLSFTRAAEELHVTQAAVSHQVRVLEEQLGVSLMRRSTRRLELTPAGERLQAAASSAFGQLVAAVAQLRRSDRQIAITTTPAFGARWLAPRLGRFAARHPDWELTVRHTTQTLDLEREGLDAAIRYGNGAWAGLAADLIVTAPLVPLASPRLVRTYGLAEPVDLTRVTLLHDEDSSQWTEWLLMAGLNPEIARRGLIFDDENALIQAALEGQGVALVSEQLVTDAVAEGRLVQPLGTRLAEDSGYYLVYPKARLKEAKFRSFREFLLAEGAVAS